MPCVLASKCKLFNSIVQKHHLEKHTKKIIFLSLSKNIAQIFTDAGFKNSLYADMPTQKSLLTKLSKI